MAPAYAQNVELQDSPRLTLTVPDLQVPDEPERHYGWPLAVMGAGIVGGGVGFFVIALSKLRNVCFGIADSLSSSCPPRSPDTDVWIPVAVGGAIFTMGLAWLIARLVRYRRAHHAYEEGTPHLAW